MYVLVTQDPGHETIPEGQDQGIQGLVHAANNLNHQGEDSLQKALNEITGSDAIQAKKKLKMSLQLSGIKKEHGGRLLYY